MLEVKLQLRFVKCFSLIKAHYFTSATDYYLRTVVHHLKQLEEYGRRIKFFSRNKTRTNFKWKKKKKKPIDNSVFLSVQYTTVLGFLVWRSLFVEDVVLVLSPSLCFLVVVRLLGVAKEKIFLLLMPLSIITSSKHFSVRHPTEIVELKTASTRSP